MFNSRSTRRRFLGQAGAVGAAASVPQWLTAATPAAATTTGATNPIVDENRNTDPGTFSAAFQLTNPTAVVAGFARKSSVNIGEDLPLCISGPNNYLPPSPDAPLETVTVDVYRLGYYDGIGGRKVWSSANDISTWQKFDGNGDPSNSGTRAAAAPVDASTGLTGFGNDRDIVTIPGSALTTTGVYLARLRANWYDYPPSAPSVARSGDSHIVFIVRDDDRPRDILALLPTNNWQAYNYFTGRSLYTYNSRYNNNGSIIPATGTERAAKVSLDRPYNNDIADYNWVLRTEFPMIWWMERHGYDVSYTDDVALSFDTGQALPAKSKSVAILGHAEYWTQEIRDSLEAARDAGTHIYNFGANCGYWRVRYETTSGQPATNADEARVLVCYKTIEGGGSTIRDPDTQSPLTGADAVASLADPVSPTTTWRDPGKGPSVPRPGTYSATPAAYTGPNRPEANLFGVQYFGDDDAKSRSLIVPADNGAGEFAGHRVWRLTGLPTTGATIGTDIVGWEWDAIPTASDLFGGQGPATKSGGELRRISQTDPLISQPSGAQNAYMIDGGRRYSVRGTTATPLPGRSSAAHAVTYTAPSGALVFSSGTIKWSWGLGPHYLDQNGQTYANPPVDGSDTRISQATTNLFSDGRIVPLTPDGVVVDLPPLPPEPEPTSPQPTTPQPTSPAAIPKLVVNLSSGRVSSTGRVVGRVACTTPVPRTVKGTVILKLGGTIVARASYSIAAGQVRSGRVTFKLSRAGRKVLAKRKTVRPLAGASIVESGRTVRTDFTRLTLNAPRARR